MRPTVVERAVLAVPLGTVRPASDTAWLVPLVAGLLLAVGLAVALLVVVRRGRRRE